MNGGQCACCVRLFGGGGGLRWSGGRAARTARAPPRCGTQGRSAGRVSVRVRVRVTHSACSAALRYLRLKRGPTVWMTARAGSSGPAAESLASPVRTCGRRRLGMGWWVGGFGGGGVRVSNWVCLLCGSRQPRQGGSGRVQGAGGSSNSRAAGGCSSRGYSSNNSVAAPPRAWPPPPRAPDPPAGTRRR